MIEKFLSLSMKLKMIIIFVPVIIIGSVVGIVTFNLSNNKTELTSATSKNLRLEEEVVVEVKEEVIVVAKDTTIDESLKEKEEEVVKFENKEVKVPKSKVSSVNSAEDAETNKKTGGEAVSQKQAETMFENVGQKSMGIDVSHHQGRINWAQVKASGVEFAIIRCGYRGQTSGGIYEDAYFKTNVAGAVANGIKVGVYFYSTAINENEALEEAAWVVKKIAPYRITYPVVYDFEDFNAKRCANVGGAQATSNALTFLNFVKSNGYEPMMYANKNDITTKMSRSSFTCKFWLAHYTSQTDYKGSYNMWQYTSKGSVPGIAGNVDMNIAYFNYGTVAEPKHTHKYTEEVKNSLVAATCLKEGSKTMRCSCGESQTEILKKLEHKFGEWEITKEATEEEKGVKTRICTLCKKEKETKDIPKLDINANTNTNTSTNTNINDNQNTNTNTDIDTNTNTNTSSNTNTSVGEGNTTGEEPVVHTHDFSVEVSRENPTCAKEGSVTYKCSSETCTETKTDVLDKTNNHNFVEGKCTTEGCDAIDENYQEPDDGGDTGESGDDTTIGNGDEIVTPEEPVSVE